MTDDEYGRRRVGGPTRDDRRTDRGTDHRRRDQRPNSHRVSSTERPPPPIRPQRISSHLAGASRLEGRLSKDFDVFGPEYHRMRQTSPGPWRYAGQLVGNVVGGDAPGFERHVRSWAPGRRVAPCRRVPGTGDTRRAGGGRLPDGFPWPAVLVVIPAGPAGGVHGSRASRRDRRSRSPSVRRPGGRPPWWTRRPAPGSGRRSPGNVSEYPGAVGAAGHGPVQPRHLARPPGHHRLGLRLRRLRHLRLQPHPSVRVGLRHLRRRPHPARRPARCPPTPKTPSSPSPTADEQGIGRQLRGPMSGSGPGAIGVRLTATTRTALGAFTFPGASASSRASAPLTATTCCSRSVTPPTARAPRGSRSSGPTSSTGSVTSGDFCGIPGNYTLYFAARFSYAVRGRRHMAERHRQLDEVLHRHRRRWRAAPGSASAAPERSGSQKVLAKVGISFVSPAGAHGQPGRRGPGVELREGLRCGHGRVERTPRPDGRQRGNR